MKAVRNRYVYFIDHENGTPCYIGIGKGDRMHYHMKAAYKGYVGKANPVKYQYFINCIARGYIPAPYKIADELTIDEALFYEKVLIAWYGRLDLGTGTLLNANSGGSGAKDLSPGTIVRMSSAGKIRMRDPEARARSAENCKNRIWSEEQRAHMRAKKLGGTTSEETKLKQSAAHMNRKKSPEHCESIRKAALARTPEQNSYNGLCRRGHKHSEDSKLLMSISHSNMSQETRKKIGDASRNRAVSIETRAKLSEIALKDWARRKAAKTENFNNGELANG